MKPKSTKLMTGLTFVALLSGCASESGGNFISAMLAPPPPPLNVEKVGQAITDTSSNASGTNIFTNVFNGAGGSCVEASKVRGRAIADKLQDMQLKGDIPKGDTTEVHTYSGYVIPGIGSMHTYTVTQIRDVSGKVIETWTTDDYLGPNLVNHYSGDGGYTSWDEYKIDLVKPTTPSPVFTPFKSGGGGGGGGGGGHSH